jgi:hypothetical protein
MEPFEREILAGLPSTVEVFRGFNDRGGEDGISWALQRDFAETFARRWALYASHRIEPPAPDQCILFVARAVVPREEIVACFERESAPGTETSSRRSRPESRSRRWPTPTLEHRHTDRRALGENPCTERFLPDVPHLGFVPPERRKTPWLPGFDRRGTARNRPGRGLNRRATVAQVSVASGTIRRLPSHSSVGPLRSRCGTTRRLMRCISRTATPERPAGRWPRAMRCCRSRHRASALTAGRRSRSAWVTEGR